MIRRRALLRGALCGLAGAALPRPGVGAEPLAATRVRDALTVVAGAGGNVLVHAANDGQLLVDSGARGFTEALLAALGDLPGGGRVHTLVNTHWHAEQTGSNAALGEAGARIIAHEKTRLRLSTAVYVPHEDRYEPPLPPEGRPVEAFYTDGAAAVGGEQIRYGYLLEAHTDGDIYVHFTNANVIAVGDAVSPERDPVLDWFGGGWLGGRVDSLAALLRMSDADTRFVPSFGPVVDRAAVQAEHDMMLVLFERMVELVRKGLSAEDVLAAGVLDGTRQWQDPLRFVDSAHRGMWAHHNTLSPDIV
jgi:glyoxylase-like metal-dependent hydrolase (beta-lactamase superfamily II)